MAPRYAWQNALEGELLELYNKSKIETVSCCGKFYSTNSKFTDHIRTNLHFQQVEKWFL